jgi:cell division protein FtsI (penicillin-binding protein 3)
MASLPDYDPTTRRALKPDRLNRVSAGMFELGSIFKTTFAMAFIAAS